ncbi:MAG TPA: hypothetical protein VN328_05730, partial [Thermodesulfovibrionales bacterium]|nr:hypothetical protein [Thermodesulfovibrionales bacterium]
RNFVQIEYLIDSPVGDYRKNFLFVGEKLQAKLGDFYFPLHIGVILEVLFLLLVVLAIRRNRQLISEKQQLKFLVVLLLFALFLTTPIAMPVWDFLPGFPTLQFPWRWLTVVEVSICLLIGAVFPHNTGNVAVTLKRPMTYLLITFLLLSLVLLSRSKTLPEEFVDRILIPMQTKRFIDPPIEYTPVWVKDVEGVISETMNERISVISGSASALVTEWKSERRTLRVRASAPSVLRVSTFYYPGWKAWLDGNIIQIETEEESGAMLLGIGVGEHMLELKFADTPIRFYSKIISLVSFLVFTFLAVFLRRRGKKA